MVGPLASQYYLRLIADPLGVMRDPGHGTFLETNDQEKIMWGVKSVSVPDINIKVGIKRSQKMIRLLQLYNQF